MSGPEALAEAMAEMKARIARDEPNRCHAGRDGDCNWNGCPQESDGRKNYKPICPLYVPDPEY